MNEEQYNALCEACDELLQASDATPERVAIPWLHVIRPHPIFLGGYADIFAKHTASGGMRRIRNIASALRRLGKALVSSQQPWSEVGKLPAQCDLLIVSHLLNESFSEREGDFYYGKAASELEAKGLSATIALINYTKQTPATLAGRWRQAKIPRAILASQLEIAKEWSLYRRAFVEARRLKNIAADAQLGDLDGRVATRAALEATSGGTVSALRIGEQIKMLVARLQPRAMLVTYEGHSWERVAFAAARSVLPQIRCIGYQHAALFNLQHAIQRKLADRFNPNIIFTAGHVACTTIKKKPALKNIVIETLGSIRCAPRKVRFKQQITNNRKFTCLVLPEGDANECNLLFGFSLKCARLMPGTEFIWRLHPSMNYAALMQQNQALRDLPSNITLSLSALAEDISRSDCALYRGSTAIVQAVMSGLHPIYLSQCEEIPIDPLYEIDKLIRKAVIPEDFIHFASELEGAGADIEKIQEYCEQVFSPMNSDVLMKILARCSSHKPI